MSSTHDDPAHTGFVALPVPDLRALGITGKQPWVSCHGDALVVRDEHGHALEIPAARVRCLRLGAIGTKFGKVHVARVFADGLDVAAPLLLRAENPHDRGYAPVLRRFATAVAARRGLEALEHGLGDGDARGLFLWVLAVAIAGCVLALTVWAEPFGTIGIVAFIVTMALVVAFTGWESFSRHRPTRLASFAEVDRYLPR